MVLRADLNDEDVAEYDMEYSDSRRILRFATSENACARNIVTIAKRCRRFAFCDVLKICFIKY